MEIYTDEENFDIPPFKCVTHSSVYTWQKDTKYHACHDYVRCHSLVFPCLGSLACRLTNKNLLSLRFTFFTYLPEIQPRGSSQKVCNNNEFLLFPGSEQRASQLSVFDEVLNQQSILPIKYLSLLLHTSLFLFRLLFVNC